MTSPVMLGGGQVRLEEVYLSGSTGQGPAVVGGLALLADDQGLTVLGPQPSSVRTMPWGRASTIACRQPAQLPDGRAAVMLEVDIDGNALRFFVPQANLGPQGAGALEERLTALARIPAAVSPPVVVGDSGPAASGWGPAGQPISQAIQGKAMQGLAGQGTAGPVSAGPGLSRRPRSRRLRARRPPSRRAPSRRARSRRLMVWHPQAKRRLSPAACRPASWTPGALPPATGGTLSGTHGPSAGQYVRAGKRHHGRRSRVAAVLVVVLVAGGAGAYVLQSHEGSSSGSGTSSEDALAAAQVNLEPGDVPGWKGVPGTIAGRARRIRDRPGEGTFNGLFWRFGSRCLRCSGVHSLHQAAGVTS